MGDYGFNFHPFTDPYLRAKQLELTALEIQQRKAAEDRQRQQFEMDMADRQHARAVQDLHTGMLLQDSGYLPTQEGPAGALKAALAGRGTTRAPNGQLYSIPTTAQKNQLAEQQAEQAGHLKGVTQKAYLDEADPEETFSAPNPAGVPTVWGGGQHEVTARQSQKQKIVQDALARATPKYQYGHADNAVSGDRTFYKVGPDGKPIPTGTLSGAVERPARAAAAAKPLVPTNEEIESWINKPGENGRSALQNLFNDRGITQDVIDAANGRGTKAERDSEGNKTGRMIPTQLPVDDPTRKAAMDRINAAKKEIRVAAKDALTAQYKNQATQNAQAASRPQGEAALFKQATAQFLATGKKPGAIKTKDLPAALKHTGMDANQFSRWWHGIGGTITP